MRTFFCRFLLLTFAACLLLCANLTKSAAQLATPQRIISLSPGNTEILYALGLGSRIVGDTTYCDYPPAAARKPHIGNLIPNYEKIVALHPDLIVVDGLANRQDIPGLNALHLRLLVIQAATLAQVEKNIVRVAAVCGVPKSADTLLHTMRHKIASADAIRVAHPGMLRTAIIIERNPLMVAGADTFMAQIIARAGGKNIVAGSFITYSTEAAIAANPQVIFCSAADARALRTDPAWRTTSAVKNEALFTLNEDEIDRPGPRLADALIAAAKDIASAQRRGS